MELGNIAPIHKRSMSEQYSMSISFSQRPEVRQKPEKNKRHSVTRCSNCVD